MHVRCWYGVDAWGGGGGQGLCTVRAGWCGLPLSDRGLGQQGTEEREGHSVAGPPPLCKGGLKETTCYIFWLSLSA